MKKKVLFIFLGIIILLSGCSKEMTFEEYFHKSMEEIHKDKQDYSYSLIYTEDDIINDDAIAVFKEENSTNGLISIGYYKEEDNSWKLVETKQLDLQSLPNWAFLNQDSYIYVGLIDDSVSKVFIGEKLANIIEIQDGVNLWYGISDVKDVEIKAIKDDDSKDIINADQTTSTSNSNEVLDEETSPSKDFPLLELANEGKIDGIEFGIGTSTEKLIEEWGLPDEYDYFLGGLYFSYPDKDVIFFTGASKINEEIIHDEVKAIAVKGDNKPVYNVKIGMTFEEIISVLGEPSRITSIEENEISELFYGDWTIEYDLEDYRVVFASKTEDGPTYCVFLLESYNK